MKRIFSLVLVALVVALSAITFSGCESDDGCYICGGSGYYQKKDCPGC